VRRISSRLTFFSKRIFPVLWLALLALFLRQFLRDERTLLPGLLFGILMAGVFLLIYRKLIFELCDEAWDDGSTLLVRKKGLEVRIPLAEIVNVSHDRWANPQRVTLLLRGDTPIGREISFALPTRLLPLRRSPIVDDLIARVDEARRKAPASPAGITWSPP
jgi:hypothetical protein